MLIIAKYENFPANKYENANYCQLLLAFSYLLVEKISFSENLSMKNVFPRNLEHSTVLTHHLLISSTG